MNSRHCQVLVQFMKAKHSVAQLFKLIQDHFDPPFQKHSLKYFPESCLKRTIYESRIRAESSDPNYPVRALFIAFATVRGRQNLR